MVEIKYKTSLKKNELKPKLTNKEESFIQGDLGEELDYICGNYGHLSCGECIAG